MNNTQTRYHEALKNIPPPGTGCHCALLSVANFGFLAGVKPQNIFLHIRNSIPEGSRRIPDREIQDAINKALEDHNGGHFTARTRPDPVVRDGKSTLQKIIGEARIHSEVDLWESSPIRLWDEPQNDPALLLETLYEPTDLLYIGERSQAGIIGDTIRTAEEWISYYQNGGKTAPHIILNPLTGKPAPKKTGDGGTLRGDGNIAEYHYCVVEFDNLSREEQIRFWSAVKLPIKALIDSGGKSIHAWLDVSEIAAVSSAEQWQTEIKVRLYDRILVPLGVDGACSNPARLSRLPGHFREEKKGYQRILWLSPKGV